LLAGSTVLNIFNSSPLHIIFNSMLQWFHCVEDTFNTQFQPPLHMVLDYFNGMDFVKCVKLWEISTTRNPNPVWILTGSNGVFGCEEKVRRVKNVKKSKRWEK
jgi:hypothetical protein